MTSKGKEFLCPDKVTLKDNADVSFYFKTKTRKGGKQTVKPFIDGRKWGKKSKTKTKGAFTITQTSKKVVTITHETSGLSLKISKLKGYFKFDITVSVDVSPHVTGLCQGVVDTPDRGSPDLSATKVGYCYPFVHLACFQLHFIVNCFFFLFLLHGLSRV